MSHPFPVASLPSPLPSPVPPAPSPALALAPALPKPLVLPPPPAPPPPPQLPLPSPGRCLLHVPACRVCVLCACLFVCVPACLWLCARYRSVFPFLRVFCMFAGLVPLPDKLYYSSFCDCGALPYEYCLSDLLFPESAKGVILFPWNNITCFVYSGLVQLTGTNVWAARFVCLHGPLKRERERERGEGRARKGGKWG